MGSIQFSVGHVGDNSMAFMAPMVLTWLKNGVSIDTSPINTERSNGRLSSTLSFVFSDSDAVEYYCIFKDITRSELLIPSPIRLDTGNSKVIF